MLPLRVVLDANVIISALIRPNSAPGRILRAAVERTAERLVTSNPLLAELRAALEYPRLQRYLKMSKQDKEAFVILLEQIADPVRIGDSPAPLHRRDALGQALVRRPLQPARRHRVTFLPALSQAIQRARAGRGLLRET